MAPVLDLRLSDEPRHTPRLPATPLPTGPRGLGAGESVALAALFVALVVGVRVPLAALERLFGWDVAGFWPIVAGQLLAGPVVIALGLRWSGLRFRDACPLRPVAPRLLPALVLASVGLAIVLEELARRVPGFNLFRDAILAEFRLSGAAPALIAVVIGAPVLEELLCRGVLLRGLLRRHSAWAAVSITALIFGLFHLNPWQAVSALPLGLAFGWLTLRTGSVLTTIVSHAVVNSSGWFVAALLLAFGYRLRDIQAMKQVPPALLVIGAVAALVGCAVLWWQLRGSAAESGDVAHRESRPFQEAPAPATLRVSVTLAAAFALFAFTFPLASAISRGAILTSAAGCYDVTMPPPVAAALFPGVRPPVRLELSRLPLPVAGADRGRYRVRPLDAPTTASPAGDATPVYWFPLRAGGVTVVRQHGSGGMTLLRLSPRGDDFLGDARTYAGPRDAAPAPAPAPADAVLAHRVPCPSPGAARR